MIRGKFFIFCNIITHSGRRKTFCAQIVLRSCWCLAFPALMARSIRCRLEIFPPPFLSMGHMRTCLFLFFFVRHFSLTSNSSRVSRFLFLFSYSIIVERFSFFFPQYTNVLPLLFFLFFRPSDGRHRTVEKQKKKKVYEISSHARVNGLLFHIIAASFVSLDGRLILS